MFREKQQITICLIAAVVIGGFVLFRFIPLHGRISTVKQARAAQMLTIAKGNSDREQMPLFISQLSNLKNKLSEFDAIIPEQRELGTFVHQIAELMNQHNLREQEIAPGTEIEADGLNCIPVSIQCKGQLSEIFQFYQLLQKLDRMIRIKQVKLTNNSDYTGEVSVKTDVVIYYRTDNAY